MKDYNNNDKAFREKITSHEFQFDPSAWDKMEKMLDDEDPRRAIAWRYPYMMMIVGVLFVGITLFSPANTTQNDDRGANQMLDNTVINNTSPTTIKETTNTALTIEPAIASANKTNNIINPNKPNTVITQKSSQPIISKISEASTINAQTTATTLTTNAIVEKPVYQNTNTISINQQLTPSVIDAKPIEAVKNYINTIIDTPDKFDTPKDRENIQAFMEVNSLLEPIKYEETFASLPFESEPVSVKKKKVKAGIQVGGSIILAKRSIADQGKLATAIGGFINFDLDAKNSIAVEANYKHGYSETKVFSSASNRELADLNSLPDGSFSNADEQLGYTEVKDIKRIHAVELPVVYKRKIGTRNKLIAGVKPSVITFNDDSCRSCSVGADYLNIRTIFDFGLVAGIEHQINKNFAVDLRYNQGLRKIGSIGDVNYNNSELAISVKYAF